jgi:polyisoprenoid-binding protein YceI
METHPMSIRTALLAPILLVTLAWVPLRAQAPVERIVPSASVRGGTLSFDGRATAGDFTGTTTSVTGEITGGRLEQVRGWVEAPVRTLVTGNQRRDRDLNKSMESGKYPVIRFELTGIAPPESPGDSVALVLAGRFIIHGVTREATIPARVVFRPDAIRVRGEAPLNLKDYQIGGLSKALGMLKMSEKIVVHIDLSFGVSEPVPHASR